MRTSARCLKQQSVFELGQVLEAQHLCLTLSLRVGFDGTITPLGQNNSPVLEIRWMEHPPFPGPPSLMQVSQQRTQSTRSLGSGKGRLQNCTPEVFCEGNLPQGLVIWTTTSQPEQVRGQEESERPVDHTQNLANGWKKCVENVP